MAHYPWNRSIQKRSTLMHAPITRAYNSIFVWMREMGVSNSILAQGL